jgi:hypothetical protein
VDHPVVEVGPLSADRSGRINYPMALARAIDEAGGDGFVLEYFDAPPRSGVDDPGGCCGDGEDPCFLQGDGVCQCPGTPWEAEDCAEQEDLVSAERLLGELADKHRYVTRWTTRLSPEEMTFDPGFSADEALVESVGPRRDRVVLGSLEACEDDVTDRAEYDGIVAVQDCAAVYCGAGVCVGTSAGVGCACDPGHVARRFTDLDGEPSITCVPDEPMVDLAAGGLELPSACEGAGAGAVEGGSCLDVGGFAAIACAAGSAAVEQGRAIPGCAPITQIDQRPGAEDYAAGFAGVRVCFPKPSACGRDGWLVPAASGSQDVIAVACEDNEPDPSWTVEPEPRSCGEDRFEPGEQDEDVTQPRPDVAARGDDDARSDEDGGGCAVGGHTSTPTAIPMLAALALLSLRRRRLARPRRHL